MDVDNQEDERGDDACLKETVRVRATNRKAPRTGTAMMAVMPTAKTKYAGLAIASFHLFVFHFAFVYS